MQEAIPFARLLRTEWGKATDTRAPRWLLAATGATTVAIMLAPLLARHDVDQNYGAYLDFAALALATLLPVVSILTLTTEWTQRTVLVTFTQEPRRLRVMRAKITVTALMAVTAAVVGALVALGAVGVAAGSGRHVAADLSSGHALGFVLFVVLNLMMGVAFGALLHNSAAAIVSIYLVPGAFGILGAVLDSVGHWIDPGTTWDWLLHGQWGGHAAQIGVSTLLWVGLPLWLGLIRTARREVM